jgi:hypothetical protein
MSFHMTFWESAEVTSSTTATDSWFSTSSMSAIRLSIVHNRAMYSSTRHDSVAVGVGAAIAPVVAPAELASRGVVVAHLR